MVKSFAKKLQRREKFIFDHRLSLQPLVAYKPAKSLKNRISFTLFSRAIRRTHEMSFKVIKSKPHLLGAKILSVLRCCPVFRRKLGNRHPNMKRRSCCSPGFVEASYRRREPKIFLENQSKIT